MHPLFSTPTHNHKPQLGPQHITLSNHHDEVRKNGIPYALGLMRSIAYRRNCLVNRNPDIIVEMTLHVGKKIEIKVFVGHKEHFLPKGA
jgi:hypothetical protein